MSISTSPQNLEHLKTRIASGLDVCLTLLPQCPEEITLLHYAFSVHKDYYVDMIKTFMLYESKSLKKLINDINKSLVENETKNDVDKINGVVGKINQYIVNQTSDTMTIETLEYNTYNHLEMLRKAVKDPLMLLPRQEKILNQTLKRICELGDDIKIQDEDAVSEYFNRVLRIILPQILDEFEVEQEKKILECKLFCRELLHIATDPLLNNNKILILRNINHFLIDKL